MISDHDTTEIFTSGGTKANEVISPDPISSARAMLMTFCAENASSVNSDNDTGPKLLCCILHLLRETETCQTYVARVLMLDPRFSISIQGSL